MTARRSSASGKQNPDRAVHRRTADEDLRQRLLLLEQAVQDLKQEVARQYEPEPLPPGELGLVLCRVGQSQVAFLQDHVTEVVAVPLLAPLPEAPFWVSGLLNLRGVLVPVIDVLARVSGRARPTQISDFVVIAEVEDRPVGFLVQEILDLKRSEATRIEQPRQVPLAPYLVGALHIDGGAVLVLNPVALLRLADLPEVEDA